MEEVLRNVKGVIKTEVGYSGGHFENPAYRDVCTGKTGHAEVVLAEYDPSIIHLRDLLSIFFDNHDPTSINRQGADIGSQYRSAIYYYTAEQKNIIDEYIKNLEKSGVYNRPIVTEVMPAGEFYRAEEYHQQYYRKRKGL